MARHEGPASGVSFRLGSATAGRVALEVLLGDELIGVHVDTRFSTPLLGALRGRRGGSAWALAWGRLPRDGRPPVVTFHGGWPGRRRRLAAPVEAMGAFWVCRAPGRFRSVAVALGAGAGQCRGLARFVRG